MLQIVVYLHIIFVCIAAVSIPPYVKLCKRHDPNIEQCVIKTIYDLIPQLSKGIKEMNVPPIDPLNFKNISFNTGNGGSIQLKATISNGVVAGMRGIEFKKLKYDLDHGNMQVDFVYPFLQFNAQYEVSGKLLLFQLDGSGPVSCNATGVSCRVTFNGHYQTKNNKEYLIFDKMDVDAAPKTVTVKIENMFPNNPALTEMLNTAVNGNVMNLLQEMEPIIKETLEKLGLEYFNSVYSAFPITELYPEE